MLDSKECHLRSLPCTRSRTSPSCASSLHAENPLASITRQKPQQGLMLVHHLSSEQQKRESQKQFVITIPPRLLAHHQVGCGCYRTPHSTPPRAESRPAVSPVPGPLQSGWRGPRAPTQGQQGCSAPESWDDGDLKRESATGTPKRAGENRCS